MRNATKLIALTQAELDGYRALGVDTPCEIIPNGIDVSQFDSPPVATELPLPSARVIILFMGRLLPTKGVDRLLKAFELVHERIPGAVLVLAGPDERGLEKNFRAMATQGNVQEKVFFPGMISGPVKQAFLSRAALFCLPSKTEGFSMAVLEALASGTPVLLSPGCNFPQVEEAGAGQIVSDDPNILGEALVALLSDPNRLLHMGQIGREFVARNYNWPTIIDRLSDLYERALARAARA